MASVHMCMKILGELIGEDRPLGEVWHIEWINETSESTTIFFGKKHN